MKTPRFRPDKPYAEVWGSEPGGARYLQNGHSFRANGAWITPDDFDASEIEEPEEPTPPQVEPGEYDPEAIDEPHMRAMCRLFNVPFEPGITLGDLYRLTPLPDPGE